MSYISEDWISLGSVFGNLLLHLKWSCFPILWVAYELLLKSGHLKKSRPPIFMNCFCVREDLHWLAGLKAQDPLKTFPIISCPQLPTGLYNSCINNMPCYLPLRLVAFKLLLKCCHHFHHCFETDKTEISLLHSHQTI